MERDVDLVIENLRCGLQNYGYRVTSKPLPGMEWEYADQLRQALSMLDRNADHYRKAYGLRGKSKNLCAMLHASMPEPFWGIEAP